MGREKPGGEASRREGAEGAPAEESLRPGHASPTRTPTYDGHNCVLSAAARTARTRPSLYFPGVGCLLTRAARSFLGQDGGGGGPGARGSGQAAQASLELVQQAAAAAAARRGHRAPPFRERRPSRRLPGPTRGLIPRGWRCSGLNLTREGLNMFMNLPVQQTKLNEAADCVRTPSLMLVEV